MAVPAMRLRVTFSKGGVLAYTSHLDVLRAWVRTLRRARIPLAYTGGFNPRPKLQFASALPLGHTGESELMDVWLEKPVPTAGFGETLGPVMPAGLTVGQTVEAPLAEPPLQNRVMTADYLVTVKCAGPVGVLVSRTEDLLAACELPRERRGRQYDLRPLIERLQVEASGSGQVLFGMHLAARQGATARPEAVVESLGLGSAFTRYHRRGLVLANV